MSQGVLETASVADVLDRLLLWARREAPAPLSSTSITTLDSLADLGPQRVTDLAAREHVTQPTMTVLVRRLAAQGHVERVPHPHDRRSTLVGITASGRDVLASRHAQRTATLGDALGRLSAEHRTLLAGSVGALEALVLTTRHPQEVHP